MGTVAIAGYQASVNKTQSDNSAAVAIADSAADADIMRSVSALGRAGVEAAGVDVGGDYTNIGGNMDNSISTTTTNDNDTTTDNGVETYTTSEGQNLTIEDLEALLGAGLRITVIIDGEEVEVEQCEDGGLTFGGSSCVGS